MINKMPFSRTFVFVWLLCSFFAYRSGAQNNKFHWVQQVGGSIQDNGYAVAADSKGNVYATGSFQNNCFIGVLPNNDSLITHGGADIFLTKMDRAGNLLWAHAIGGTSSDEGHALAVDKNDNIIITGSFRDTVDFATGTTPAKRSSKAGSHDVFVAKYDSAGNYLWVKSFGSSQLDRAFSVKTDDRNNVYITGQFYDTVAIPDLNISLIARPGTAIFTTDVFVCKLNAGGTFIWAKSFGGAAGDVGDNIAVDKSDNVFISGQFNDIADFDPGTGITSLNAADGPIFISKLDATGAFQWVKQFNTNYAPGHQLAVDLENSVYLTGEFSGIVDFNPGTAAADTFFLTSDYSANSTTIRSNDAFLLKLTNNGLFSWVHRIGGSGTATGRGVTLDRLNNIYVVGTFTNIIDFGGTAPTINYTSLGSNDVFVEKVNNTGNLIWATRYGGKGAEFCRAIAVDESGNVFTAGHFVTTLSSGPANFHTGTDTAALTIHGGYDAYVHKMVCPDTTYRMLSVTECNQYAFDGITYTTSGIYTRRYWSLGGCDSIITLNLTVNNIDTPFITVNNFELGVTSVYATYQWLRNGVAIQGATGNTLTVTSNADYRVVVTAANGCTDTSDIYTVTNATGINDKNGISSRISIYPTPASDVIHINSPVAIQITLADPEGRTVKTGNNITTLSVKDLSPGLYLLRVFNKEGQLIKTSKISKQ